MFICDRKNVEDEDEADFIHQRGHSFLPCIATVVSHRLTRRPDLYYGHHCSHWLLKAAIQSPLRLGHSGSISQRCSHDWTIIRTYKGLNSPTLLS